MHLIITPIIPGGHSIHLYILLSNDRTLAGQQLPDPLLADLRLLIHDQVQLRVRLVDRESQRQQLKLAVADRLLKGQDFGKVRWNAGGQAQLQLAEVLLRGYWGLRLGGSDFFPVALFWLSRVRYFGIACFCLGTPKLGFSCLGKILVNFY
jgi:hypothetical protein